MFVYWSMFLLPAIPGVFSGSSRRQLQGAGRYLLLAVMLVFAVLIGLRFEVGGDWFVYENIIGNTHKEPLAVSLQHGDPGFMLLSWASMNLGLGPQVPTLVCGAILMWGVARFVEGLKEPWLALAAAVPYLLIVVGMGYVRQAAAIGFLLLAIRQYETGKTLVVLRWVFFASLFHATALVLLPLFLLGQARRNVLSVVGVGLVGTVLFGLFLSSRLDRFFLNYVDAELESSGALVRLAMNAVPAAFYVLLFRRFEGPIHVRLFWLGASLISLGLVVLYYFTEASTVLDRLGLYFIPLQLYVFGNLASVISARRELRILSRYFVVVLYGAVLYIWLNFATHAEYWLPYRFLPLEEGREFTYY